MPYKKITIQYKNGKVTALNAPYNVNFISEIKSVQTASYDVQKKAWSCHERFGLVLESLVSKHFEKNPVIVEGSRPVDQYTGTDYKRHILISYFRANGQDWVSLSNTPYNPRLVQALHTIPTAHYSVDAGADSSSVEKEWTFRAEYGKKVEDTVRMWLTDPIDVVHFLEENNS